ncbi:NADH-ubiquinone oxidoreductase-F iron-sulfur binding region domain-containing protein [Arthrobacter sp. TWP1-1]|uniref:NADH-ubiquinone oxidoreductase-F iron-sulfur binding region domain-containing protein n=1 Tax=Arthrobacter sp. TWP1-1 TaxID=2804568 RepID=UPI003CF0617A
MTTLIGTQQIANHHEGTIESGRLFAAGANASLIDHEQAYGPLELHGINASFIDVVARAGLTGRGGAAFASWRKLAATQSNTSARRFTRTVVIANGAEGGPLSFKDKTLLANAPHLVIDGVLVAGRAVNDAQLYMYVNAGSMPAVKAAISQRHDASKIKVILSPDTFLSGEASAVVNAVASNTALPLDKRLRLSQAGLKGQPTLVLNVETLAHTALIARFGAAWFRDMGTEHDPGTRLISVSGHGSEQVLEVAGSASVGDILATAAVDPSAVQAILIGGYHGRWVRPLNYRLAPQGPRNEVVRPGAGVIHLLGMGQCGLTSTAAIARYLAGESAKQCGPCMFGLPAMAKTLTALASGDRDPRLPAELARLAMLVSGRGACNHPDGFVQLIDSALETFSEDVDAHLSGRCMATQGGQL